MSSVRIDLRSDTVSTPDHAMRNAMARADVGDDVYGEDPTVNHLEETVAEMTGFQSAVFMPTGSMSNGVAIRAMTDPGDEIICGRKSHVHLYESAQYAVFGGLQMLAIEETPDGCLPLEVLKESLKRGYDRHYAPRTLVTLENTHNVMGGLVLDTEDMEAVRDICAEYAVSLYVDGARLWHADAAGAGSLSRLLMGCRMASMCFSKALGCPVGSILVCSRADEEKVRRLRKQQGGGMRQAGILAAACLYALEHNLPVLHRTAAYAETLARGIRRSSILTLENDPPDSNIIIARTPPGEAAQIAAALLELDIACLNLSPSTLRFVTHLSLSERSVKYAADVLAAFGG